MSVPGRSPRFVDAEAERLARARALGERLGRMAPPAARLVAWPAGHVPMQLALRRPGSGEGSAEAVAAASPAPRLVYVPSADAAYRPDVLCPGMPPRFAGYIRDAARAWRLSRAQMVGAGKAAGHVMARMDAYWHGQVVYGLSLPQIGALMLRDHTTVLAGIRRVQGMFGEAFGGQEEALAASIVERRRAIAHALGRTMPGDEPRRDGVP